MGRDHLGNVLIGSGMGFARGVMLLDDGEGTFNYDVLGTGGDDVHEYLAAAAFSGNKGLHLKTRTTGATADDYLSASKVMSYPESGLLVARLKLCSPLLNQTKHLTLFLLEGAGVNQYHGQLKFVPNSNKVYYSNAAGADVELTTFLGPAANNQWLTVELIMDCAKHQYIEVFANGTRVSLAGVPLTNDGASTKRATWLTLTTVALGAAPGELYADDLYVGEYLET